MTIAGSDPGGGAGIQADLKTFAALGVYGYSVITDVIAQNSFSVARTDPVAPASVTAQIKSLTEECLPRALKTGALGNAAIVKAVARAIVKLALPAPVVDPVIIASSGTRLLDQAGERAIRDVLIPLARIVTPNIAEAETLTAIQLDTDAAIQLVYEFEEPACAIIKHTNPAGTATGETILEAYRKALQTDPLSAFGGIVAFNRTVDLAASKAVTEIFTEAVKLYPFISRSKL